MRCLVRLGGRGGGGTGGGGELGADRLGNLTELKGDRK